jgi:hypothetical protein
MYKIEVCSGLCKKVVISQVNAEDFKLLTKKRFFFTWKSLNKTAVIYKLQIEGEEDILGVMALVDYQPENRIEIKLLANSVENQGRNKKYDRIAGCLIAYACRLAADKYFENACVSLLPKTALINHYKQKYNMAWGGWQLYLEGDPLYKLLKEFSV